MLNRARLALSQRVMVRKMLDSSFISPLLRTTQFLPEFPKCTHFLVQWVEDNPFSPWTRKAYSLCWHDLKPICWEMKTLNVLCKETLTPFWGYFYYKEPLHWWKMASESYAMKMPLPDRFLLVLKFLLWEKKVCSSTLRFILFFFFVISHIFCVCGIVINHLYLHSAGKSSYVAPTLWPCSTKKIVWLLWHTNEPSWMKPSPGARWSPIRPLTRQCSSSPICLCSSCGYVG